MKLPLHLLTLVVFMAAANHAFGDVVNNTSDGERLARCLKAYLPKGWAFKDATPGPQEVPMRRGEKPEGCRIRFEGSEVIMAPPGKEYLEIFVLPRQNPMKKDLFIMD
ncbi:MAG: hypothetical protein ABI615_13360, partial [Chthoniobacterales bacterium]